MASHFKQLFRVEGKVVKCENGLLCEVIKNGKEEIISLSLDILRENNLLSKEDEEEDEEAKSSPEVPEHKREEWNDKSTKLLITLYGATTEKLRSQKRFTKKRLWEALASQMASYGHKFDEDHIRNKWVTLDRNFKATIDSNNSTGRGRKTCMYFSELSDLHSKSTSMLPEVVLGTGAPVTRSEMMVRAGMAVSVASTSRSSPAQISGEDYSDPDDPDDSPSMNVSAVSVTSSEKKSAKRERPRSVLAEIKKMRNDMLQRSEAREERRKKEAAERAEAAVKLQKSADERNRLIAEKNELTKRWLEHQMKK